MAISKYNKYQGTNEIDNIIEEIADVKIMINKIVEYMGIRKNVETIYSHKLKVLENFLDGKVDARGWSRN